MRKILVALAVLLSATAPIAASDKDDVTAVAQKFVADFNKGDTKAAAAACADETAIIDEFPPYAWQGAGACQKWIDDYDADAKKNGITDGAVTLGTPKHVDVVGDRAYLVIPSDYAFKLKGKAVKEKGSMFTFAMHKGPAGWRITGWSWAKN